MITAGIMKNPGVNDKKKSGYSVNSGRETAVILSSDSTGVRNVITFASHQSMKGKRGRDETIGSG
jgi:hypothetical protein